MILGTPMRLLAFGKFAGTHQVFAGVRTGWKSRVYRVYTRRVQL
jgi:hypothetical protein